MVFSKLNIKQAGLVLMAVMITGFILTVKFMHKDEGIPAEPVPAVAINDLRRVAKPEEENFKEFESRKPAVLDSDDETLKAFTERMKEEREQERRITDLKMKREETDLELEEQKALSELNRFKQDGIGSVNEGNSTEGPNMNIKIVYLGGTDSKKKQFYPSTVKITS